MKLTLILFLFSSIAYSQDFKFDKKSGKSLPNFIGELKIFRGKVYKVSGQGKKEEVQVGTRFFKNDTIVTESKSFAKLFIVDDTILSLGQNSELNFEDFEFVDKTERRTIYSFIRGQLSAHVKNKANEGDVQFKTKSAVMGIRGTQLLINHQIVNNSEISEFALLTGEAKITDGKQNSFILQQGERSIFSLNNENKVTLKEKIKLLEEELKSLKAEELDEATDFKPFLPYYDPAKLIETKTSTSVSTPVSELNENDIQTSSSVQDTHDEKWKQNLQKLNEKLKENSK